MRTDASPTAPLAPRRAGVVLLIARLTAREAVRGRAVAGLAAVTAVLVAIFALASHEAMDAARDAPGTETVDAIGATMLGTAAFCALLLGAIVAVFLTNGAVRGDAERGFLQPLLVRPVGRGAVVAGRLAAGAGLAAAYTAVVWLAAVAALRVAGDWSPEHWLTPAVALAAAVALVALTTVAASTVLGAMSAGMVALALVGLGFTAGMLSQLGELLGLPALRHTADVLALAVPFEALYQHVLSLVAGRLGDLSGLGLGVGPFGGARRMATWELAVIAAWTGVVATFAVGRARRLDL